MSVTRTFYPTSYYTVPGDTAWTNPTYGYANDGSTASVSLVPGDSSTLQYGFDFSAITGNATILSVQLEAKGKSGAGGCTWSAGAGTSTKAINVSGQQSTLTDLTSPTNSNWVLADLVSNVALVTVSGDNTNGISSHVVSIDYVALIVTYNSALTFTGVSPSTGTQGTTVTLTGTGFSSGVNGVTFGGNAATSVTVVNDTTLTCVAPGHPLGAVDVTVTWASTATTTLTSAFTYVMTMGSVSPSIGYAGNAVTITGSGFLYASSVTFGGVAAAITIPNNTTINATAPSHAPGATDVVVTNGTTTVTSVGGFTYRNLPQLLSVSPTVVSPGDTLTISGTQFTGTAPVNSVKIGTTPATSVVVVNDTTITCVVPSLGKGTYDVVVENGYSNSTLTSALTYRNVPSVTSVSPTVGTNGTSVTLTGSQFTGSNNVNSVTFGGVAATAVTVVNDTTITCTAPAHTAGLVNVVAGNGYTSSTLANSFSYQVVVSSLSATSGSAGTPVTITGYGFTGATDVQFGTTSATSIVVVNDTTITCNAPAHTPGVVTVGVFVGSAFGGLNNSFTYITSLTSLSPTAGTNGTAVTLTGYGFTGMTSVTFGGLSANAFTVVNDTTITCITPTHVLGVVDVSLYYGTTLKSTLAAGYTYTFGGPVSTLQFGF